MAILSIPAAFSSLRGQVTVSVEGSGEWIITQDINPLDHTPTVYLSLAAELGTSTHGDPVVLVLRCESRKIEAYLIWDNFLGGRVFMTTRFGSEEVERQYWWMSTDFAGAFYPGNARMFIYRLKAVDSFVAQAKPHEQDPITAVFLLDGLAKAIVPLEAACQV